MCVRVRVCVYSTAISQLLPNYTNGALNRWRMEEDFTLSQTYGQKLYLPLIYCTYTDKQKTPPAKSRAERMCVHPFVLLKVTFAAKMHVI